MILYDKIQELIWSYNVDIAYMPSPEQLLGLEKYHVHKLRPKYLLYYPDLVYIFAKSTKLKLGSVIYHSSHMNSGIQHAQMKVKVEIKNNLKLQNIMLYCQPQR